MPCREGGTWLLRILERICSGHGTDADLDQILEVGQSICPGEMPHAASERIGLDATPFPYKMTTICFVGPSAYAPLHSALTLFRDEFEAKVVPRTEAHLHSRLQWQAHEHRRIQRDRTGRRPTGDVSGDVVLDDADSAVTEPEPDPDVVMVTLNGREVAARTGELVIAAAERHDTYIPHFCYHPRMKSVGMCRQCMVEVESPRGTMLVPSCTMTVNDGMVVHTQSETVKKVQEGMLEFLLLNHPLDCPVCDRGGECPLQDQTMACGPGESRFVEEKRHYEKPIPISDLVLLDRERCILCDRCTRFADEVAGDKLIQFTQRGNQTQVMTFHDEPFASYFSGNTVQICPVGALTAEPYRF